MKNVIKKFNSINDFCKYLQKETAKTWLAEESHGDRDADWYGTKDYETADRLLKYGDLESYEAMKAGGLCTAANVGTRQTRQLYSAVVGAMPNVAAFVAGAPNSMIAQRKVNQKIKVINVCYEISYSSLVSQKTITKIGNSVINEVKAIEAAGQRCNLYLSITAQIKDTNVCAMIKVKDAGQTFDLKKLAYPMVNLSMLRRHGFRFIEVTEGIPFSSNYGSPVTDTSKLKDIFSETVNAKNMIVVNGQNIAYHKVKPIEEQVKEAMKG